MSSSIDPRPREPLRILLLGGSTEATMLAHALAGRAGIAATFSLAGRTMAPVTPPLHVRVGGFGGAAGLVNYLRSQHIDLLVDATHPFAVQMSRHAREAARLLGCPLVVVGRPPWTPWTGDVWQEVATSAEAASAIGASPHRVFLTVGRLQLPAFAVAPHHHYLVRTIDEVSSDQGFASARFIVARGPFCIEEELALLRGSRIEVLVTKNSGGEASRAKLDAARELGIRVILVSRPAPKAGVLVDEALAAILAHAEAVRRGV